jgi:VanZ family protein
MDVRSDARLHQHQRGLPHVNTTARRGLTHVLPPLLWAGLIFALSSRTGEELPLPRFFPHTDKVAHLAFYAVLGALLFRSGRDQWLTKPVLGWVLFCCLLGSGYGVTDEWHQSFVADRSPSVIDWLVDSVGVVAGVAGWFFMESRR